jgi:hypothetical protein
MQVEISQKQCDDITQFFDLIKSDAGIVEAFFLNPDNTSKTVYFDNREKFLQVVVALNSNGFTCYAGIQPRNGKLIGSNKSGNNNDVTALRFLYLDLDPIRPEKSNATDEEKAICLEIAKQIQGSLTNGMGYQPPVLTSSGNGFWLYMPIPEILITDDNRRELNQRLKAWGKKTIEIFSQEGVKIDPNIFDLRRLTKIPGTRIYNYPDTEQRPSRIAEILSVSFPKADQKLHDDFLSFPVELSTSTDIQSNNFFKPHDPDRIFEKCYLIRFLKENAAGGIPHAIRLALSTLSLALGDLENDLGFIKKILSGCPDSSEEKTRYYLNANKGKYAPYGCEKLRNLASEHFNGFDTAKCNCNLTPSFDPKTGILRKPSPIRYAYLMEDDLGQLFEALQFSDDSFKNFNQLMEFTGICLTSFGPQVSNAFLRSKKKERKLTNKDIKDLLDYRKLVIKLEQQSTVDVELSNEGKQESIEILKRPSLLYDYGELIRRLGVVGEKRNIRIILLALTSRITDTPISLVIKAESASGKSWLLKNCLKIMPDESYFEYTSMSNRALIYSEKDFSHKFIIFLEYSGQEDDEVNYLTRTLQSEGRLKYEYTAKVDGVFITHSIDKPGPTGFITTTTQSQIFDENETRIFSLYINESQEQTTQIVAKLGSQYESGTYEVAESEIEPWRNIQRVLKPMPVQIPYAGWLAKHIPTKKVRVRRDFERVLVSISVCALLHQYQRPHVELNGLVVLQASVADYIIVRELLEGTLLKTVTGSSPKTAQLVKIINEVYAEKAQNISSETEEIDYCVSMTDILKKVEMARRTIYRWLRPAVNHGFVEQLKKGRNSYFKPILGAAVDPELITSFLPEPGMLINAFPEISKDLEFIHPITGEKIIVEEN